MQLVIGFNIFSDCLICHHLSEFGSKTNLSKIIYETFHSWVKVTMRYMLVTWIKTAKIKKFPIVV